MRLFAKYFLCATLVMSVALLFSGYLLITFSHENAVSREVERALNQYQYDKFTVQAVLIANTITAQEDVSYDVLSRISSDLSGLTAFFDDDKSLLYSDLPPNADFTMLDEIPDNAIVHQIKTISGKNYTYICGKITQNEISLYLVAATDITPVILQKEQMAQSFIKIYFTTLGISMILILILSMLLTRPIKGLTEAANRIAHGNYNERLSVKNTDEIGALSGSFNLMADAIEDKMYELSENARQKEDFVASFAHELKTPLTSVIGYADILYQKDLPSEEVKNAAWYILSEGLRLEALALKLMDIIVLNRQDFILETMSADELLQSIVDGLKPLFDEKKVTPHLDVASANIKIEYDLFKTLLINLIDNSIKAGCNKIWIYGKKENDSYYISVIDNGRGIPASDLNRVTEAFYMVDKSRSRKQHGAGLGLALAAKIAEIHGGTLELASSEGAGTTVKTSLACERSGEGE